MKNTKYLLIAVFISGIFLIYSCCEGDMYPPSIELTFVDALTNENLITNGFIDKEEFNIYNITIEETARFVEFIEYPDSISDKSNLISFPIVPNLYLYFGDDILGKESENKFVINFNKDFADTILIKALIEKGGRCNKNYITKYVQVKYQDSLYNLNIIFNNAKGIINIKENG